MTGEPIDHDRLDRLFDGDLDACEERRLLNEARRVDGACEELAKTRRAIELLHEPVETPDMTQEILGRVQARRAFLPPKWRRVVSSGRVAAAAVLLACIGAVALAQRAWPDATSWTPEPRPISAVVESGCSEAAVGVRELVDGLGGFAAIAPVLDASSDGTALRLSDGDRAATPISVSLTGCVEPRTAGGRVFTIGWSDGSVYECKSVGLSSSVSCTAMPFEVFQGPQSYRVLRVSDRATPAGAWIVNGELMLRDDDGRASDSRD